MYGKKKKISGFLRYFFFALSRGHQKGEDEDSEKKQELDTRKHLSLRLNISLLSLLFFFLEIFVFIARKKRDRTGGMCESTRMTSVYFFIWWISNHSVLCLFFYLFHFSFSHRFIRSKMNKNCLLAIFPNLIETSVRSCLFNDTVEHHNFQIIQISEPKNSLFSPSENWNWVFRSENSLTDWRDEEKNSLLNLTLLCYGNL